MGLLCVLAGSGCTEQSPQEALVDVDAAPSGNGSAEHAPDAGRLQVTPLPTPDAALPYVPDEPLDAGSLEGRDASVLPYAREVIDFEPGPFAGYGQDRLPDIVLGPPTGRGTLVGSQDVLSLGVGGEIIRVQFPIC